MRYSTITQPYDEYQFCESVESLATDEKEAVAAGYEAFHTLQQLGPSGREKYLEEVRKYGPGLSFTSQCFDEPTSQGRSFSHGISREERDTVMDDSIADNNHSQAQVTDSTTLSDPWLDPNDYSLLFEPSTDWDAMMYDDAYPSGDKAPIWVGLNQTTSSDVGQSDVLPYSSDDMSGSPQEPSLYNATQSIMEAQRAQLYPNHPQLTLLEDGPEDSTRLTRPVDSPLQDTNANPRLYEDREFNHGLPTPPSDPSSPNTPSTCTDRGGDQNDEPISLTQSNDTNPKKRKRTRREGPIKDLSEVCAPDVRNAIERGEGLVKHDLATYLEQNSPRWQQEGFWFEESHNLAVSDYSIEDRPGHIFRHLHTAYERKSTQNLSLRVEHALLYLSWQSLTKKKQLEKQIEKQQDEDDNSGNKGKKATTLAIDSSLQKSYPEWNTMDKEVRNNLRQSFHEYMRHGRRCWLVAGVLGLGALLACGDTLAQVIKNRTKYNNKVLIYIVNYIAHAHPALLNIFRDLDGMMIQILRDETVVVPPAGQALTDRIHHAATMSLSPQKVYSNWQPLDAHKESKGLIEGLIEEVTHSL